jgi:hypothetical protein
MKEQKPELETSSLTKKNLVRVYLLKMTVGNIILVEAHDWTWKTPSSACLCLSVEEQTNWKFDCEKVLTPLRVG